MAETPAEVNNFLDYIKILVGCITEMPTRPICIKTIGTDGVHRRGRRETTDSTCPEKVGQLVINGRQGAEAYFQWFDDPAQQPSTGWKNEFRVPPPKTTRKRPR